MEAWHGFSHGCQQCLFVFRRREFALDLLCIKKAKGVVSGMVINESFPSLLFLDWFLASSDTTLD